VGRATQAQTGCRYTARRARRASWTLGALLCLAAGAGCTSGVAQAAPPSVGVITQLPSPLGCVSANGVSEDGAGTCGVGRAIDGPESVVVSPDGRNLYVDSYKNTSEPGISVFSLDPLTGTVTQLPGTSGCLTADGASQAGAGTCTRVRGLTGTGDGRDLTFTSDGRWAYMAVQSEKADPAGVVVFQRDPSTGALTPLPGSAGCITANGSSQDGAGTCRTDATLAQPNGATTSPDDRFVYVTDYEFEKSRVHVFERNTITGEISEVQCLRVAPASPGCNVARLVGGDETFAISPDGLHAYSSGYASHGISIFDRDPATGQLAEKAGSEGCISNTGADETKALTCASGRALQGPWVVVLSPDGRTLYVMSYEPGGIAIFHVNGDGSLTQLAGTSGCITLDGSSNAGPGTCAVGRALQDPYLSTVSPDGRTLYVAQSSSYGPPGGVAVFALNRATGEATQLPGLEGCVTTDGSSSGVPGVCTDGTALAGTYSVAVSPDGASVYVASQAAGALSVFSRETAPVCSPAVAATTAGAAVAVKLSCADADGQAVSLAIASGPAHGTLGAINQAAGTVTYAPAPGFSGADGFAFSASDGTNSSEPVGASVSVARPAAGPGPLLLSGVAQSASKWREGNALAQLTRRRAPLGTTFTFTLNRAASVRFAFTQAARGRKVGRLCVAPTKRNSRRHKCTRTVTAGTLLLGAHAGADRMRFQGRLSHARKLRPGRYTVQITATDAGGIRSASQKLSFVIVAR